VLAFGDFELQPEQRRLLQRGAPVPIGARAFDVLLALVERRDQVVTKSDLIDRVWAGLVVEENNLQVQISGLRKLLGPQAIATIPGRGYRFTAAPDSSADPRPSLEAGQPAQAPGVRADAPVLSNLPVVLPPLFGREADLPVLHALIEAHRLVTVVGAGGLGKTSIARASAHALRTAFEDGVWLVELAPVADASLVVGTVAGTLHVDLGSAPPLETLTRALSSSRMLILLDNCEHLVDGVAELVEALLRAAPEVRLLATSQEPLRASEEQLYRLAALAVPDDVGVAGARHAGAVALFEARARAAQPSFAIDEENVAAVVDICRRLDGIALAIELAAARVPLLGVEGLRARLDERFRVLNGGARLALRRHQTLRAALDWSHGLLTADEQTVFRRLGIFVGGFALESGQRVAADGRIDEWDVLDHLGALVDKSLVAAEAGHEPRYRLLESSRVFALEKLREAGESEGAMRNHAEAVLAVYERSHADEFELPMKTRQEHCLPDLDNARAALDWAARAGDSGLHIALAGAIAWIWDDAGFRPEGVRRTRAAMDRIGPDAAPHLEARLLAAWPRLAHPVVGPEEIAAHARAVDIYRSLGERRLLYATLCQQARYQPYAGQLEEAERALQEAESLFDPAWPPRLRYAWLRALSYLRDSQGRIEESVVLGEEMLRLAKSLNDGRMTVGSLINLEQSIASLGRLEESVARGHELLELLQHDRSLRGGNEHHVLVNLNMSLIRLGRIDEALAISRRVLPIKEKMGRVPDLVEQCALLAFKRGRIADAARMLGCTESGFAVDHLRRDPVEQIVHQTLVDGLREALPAAELSGLRREGASLSYEEALRLGLRD
jgi:predicted ATPase/DNA-binding winged helix-turn-helix (wHTH) protein